MRPLVKPGTMPRPLAEAMVMRRDRRVVRELVDWFAVERRGEPIDATWRASFGGTYIGASCEAVVRAALRSGACR